MCVRVNVRVSCLCDGSKAPHGFVSASPLDGEGARGREGGREGI